MIYCFTLRERPAGVLHVQRSATQAILRYTTFVCYNKVIKLML